VPPHLPIVTPSTAEVPVLSADEIARHALTGPRYTSYPPATEFSTEVGPEVAAAELERLGARKAEISLYVHLPFCKSLCWYCGCNVVATRDRARATSYVDTLLTELAMVARPLDGAPITELALGGGSPNFLLIPDLRRLAAAIRRYLNVAPEARLSVELDPRDTTVEQLDAFAEAGFTSMSVGVQDFAEAVQDAIHRHQTVEMTRTLLEAARARGLDDINVDIVYGLPRQTETSFADTIDSIIELGPDRIALFGYAHLPEKRPHQSLVERAGKPLGLEARAELVVDATARLRAAGYLPIGLDHFAKPGSPLERAAAEGRLTRNFQGYVVRRADAVVGIGATAISDSGGAFWQDAGDLAKWSRALAVGKLPVERGVQLDDDDRLRREVIMRLMCDGVADLRAIGEAHGVDAATYFADEVARLGDQGELCAVDGDLRITTTPLGKVLVRNVAMTFDRYLRNRPAGGFSTTV